MNPGDRNNTRSGEHQDAGLTLEDVYFTLFRHKWLILAFCCLGLVAAAVVPLVRPPAYVSWAKVMVLYVAENKGDVAGPDMVIKSTDTGAAGVINSEIEILKSADVAAKVAAIVGPEKILAKRGGGNDLTAAAGVVLSGIEVENPRGTEVLTISFRHRDKTLVQPVLNALIDTYMQKHLEVWIGTGGMKEYYNQQSAELRKKLVETEDELRKIKEKANVVSVEATKRAFQESLLKWQQDLLIAKGELAESVALLNTPGGATNTNSAPVPFDKVEDYSTVVSGLDAARKRERDLLIIYTEAHPLTQTVRAQIEKLKRQKLDLEREFPSLTPLGAGTSRSGTNSLGIGMAVDLATILRLKARVSYIETVISDIQAQSAHVLELEPTINEVQRQRDMLETNYHALEERVHQSLTEKDSGTARKNMRPVQEPTAPSLDSKKLRKQVAGVFAACVACGLGLAFLFDLVLNRTIRRSADIERHLRLPVFLTIPDTAWTGRRRLPWLARWLSGKFASGEPAAGNGSGPAETSLAPWNPGNHLEMYTEGLRERLMTYFEVHNLNLKKPKLVAVTGCGEGSGVSTLAGGLAAALSKTGDGNVLLVDMNEGQGVTHSFHKGELGCGLSAALEPDGRLDAQVQEHLYLAKMDEGNREKVAKMLPTRFNHLVPKLKGSDYDYIIFDMPPVTQTSSTPRLASYMDITLLVLESEKTGQQLASRASALMRGSRANVAAVLNKYRPRVPARLSQEL